MNINKTKIIVFMIYFVSVMALVVLFSNSYHNLKKTDSEIEKLDNVINELFHLENIDANINETENNQSEYLKSGNNNFLIAFNAALLNLKRDTLINNHVYYAREILMKRIDLNKMIHQKLFYADSIINTKKSKGINESSNTSVLINQRKLMFSITNQLNILKKYQLENINNFKRNNDKLNLDRVINNLLILLILVFTSIITYFIINKGFKEHFKKEKELKYNTALLSNLYDPVITTDLNYHITSWNENAEKLFGYTEKEVIGKRLKEVLRSKSSSFSIDELRDIIAVNKRWNGDLTYLSKENNLIYANVSTSLVFDENDENIGTVSIIRDITKTKLAESKLQLLSENLEAEINKKIKELSIVFERTTDAFIAFDTNLNYTFVNEKAAILHQQSINEMIGKNILDNTPHISSPEFYEALKYCLNTKKEMHIELEYALKEKWFENWIYPDENGVSVFYRDITSRKKTEKELKNGKVILEQLNYRFELILKGTNDAIWDWNLETNEIWGNDKYNELLKNKPIDQSNYEYFIERMHPDDLTTGFEKMNTIFTEKKSVMISEYKFLNPENNWIHLFNRQTILYNAEGKPYRILGAIQDISEQKKIQGQIIHEKELSDVLINSLPGVFYMFNKNGKFLRWNKNLLEITGNTDEKMKNELTPVDFVPEEQRALFSEKIENVFKTGIDSVEGELLVKNNERIPYYFTGIFIKYNGEDCMMGVGIDIADKIKTQKELRELATHLQNIREEERSRIAREIHDELGQQLTGLKMEISWLKKKLNYDNIEISKKLNDSVNLIDEMVKSVRRIATQLRPSMLDDLGLIAALEWQSDEFQKRFNIKSEIKNSIGNLLLSHEKSTAIFRIYQECLTNILRHSDATEVHTNIYHLKDFLVMSIKDNGVGFDEMIVNKKKSLGILGMKERTIMLGGSYHISSKKNEGVTVLVKLPLDV